MTQNIGELLASDDEVESLKPRKKVVAQASDKPHDPIHSERVTIVLEENENIPPTGQFFGVNGRAYMLRPGEAASVPKEIISILNDAVQEVPHIDPTTRQVIGYRKKMRFPYRVVQPT
jgi:hypothetical protein